MNRSCLLCLGAVMWLYSCSPNENNQREKESIALQKAVETYALKNLNNGKTTVGPLEKITIADTAYRYVADLKETARGRIDGDTLSDAVVPVKVYKGQMPVRVEHLVFVKEKASFQYAGTLEKIYKIKEIKANTIIAEYTDLPFDSPIYGCRECIRVYKYQLIGDLLVKVDSIDYK